MSSILCVWFRTVVIRIDVISSYDQYLHYAGCVPFTDYHMINLIYCSVIRVYTNRLVDVSILESRTAAMSCIICVWFVLIFALLRLVRGNHGVNQVEIRNEVSSSDQSHGRHTGWVSIEYRAIKLIHCYLIRVCTISLVDVFIMEPRTAASTASGFFWFSFCLNERILSANCWWYETLISSRINHSPKIQDDCLQSTATWSGNIKVAMWMSTLDNATMLSFLGCNQVVILNDVSS